MKTISKSIVKGLEEVKESYVLRKTVFLIFPVTWWEKISTEHIGNDIMIETEHEIRQIILNGEVFIKSTKEV